MNTVLTSTARAQLTSVVLGNPNTIVVPQYLELGTGSGTAAATDETTWCPITPRIPCAVSMVTSNTTNDTFQCVGSYTATQNTLITNLGLFTVSTSPPVGTVLSQVNIGATAVQVQGIGNFPNTYPFDVQIGSEVMTVTSGSGTTWTVVRGTNGSSPTTSAIAIGTPITGGKGTSNGTMFFKSSFSPIPLDTGSSIEFVIDLQFA
jgi:hypothetical protein